MARVSYTPHLTRFFPELAEEKVEAASVAALIAALDERHAGLAGYLIEDHGALRKHVNISVDGEPLRDRAALGDSLSRCSRVHILQALSGG